MVLVTGDRGRSAGVTDWTGYDAWNAAIADVLYSPAMAGVPAYLDLNDDVLAQIGLLVGESAENAEASLLAAVMQTLGTTGGLKQLFQPLRERLALWKAGAGRGSREPEPPPVLALLAVTVLAAEAMGTGKVAPHAYFAHLRSRLGATTDQQKKAVEASYRADAEAMWGAVEVWLSELGGERGLPTAFALSHRFIGLPLSQALVRSADRARLPRFFDSFGLPAGYAMPPSDMAGLVNQWVAQKPCPVTSNFDRLWKRSAARDRMAEVVALELQHWNGELPNAGPGSGAPTRGRLRVLAMLSNRLGKLRLELTLAMRAWGQGTRRINVLGTDGTAISLSFQPSSGGHLLLDYNQPIEMGLIIAGVFQGIDEDGAKADRQPRRIVPLSYDDAQAAFVETERVQLAQEALLLVQDHGDWPNQVETYLGTVARQGFVRHPSTLTGLPSGWVLFSGVEVLFRGTGSTAQKFTELVPLGSAQLSASRGLKLPGRIRKWSSRQPPEIHAISQTAQTVRVLITSRQVDDAGSSWSQEFVSTDSPALVIDIAALELADGDYRLSLFEDDNKTPMQQLELRLRSSATWDDWTWINANVLRHHFDQLGAISALKASRASGDRSTHIVNGPWAQGLTQDIGPSTLTSPDPWWTEKLPDIVRATLPITVITPDERSCVVTGAHFLDVPQAEKGPDAARFLDGVCVYCGLVKRLPAWTGKPKMPVGQSTIAVPFDVRSVAPVRNRDVGVSWEAALDGVMYIGGGSYNWLERIALQVEGSQLFAHHFLKALEGLGVIDVARDEYLNPVEWELVPRYLPRLADGAYALIGHWPWNITETFLAQALLAGGTHQHRKSPDGPTINVIGGLAPLVISDLAEAVDATVVPASTQGLLAALPTLGEVMDALPRISIPGGRAVEAFHVPSARWVRAESTSGIGAFRVNSGAGWQTIFRTEEDFAQGQAAVASTYLAKHLAARLTGRPLMAYLPKAQKLLVPIGADLPGLYERAMVLSSGQLPEALEGRAPRNLRFTSYSGVSMQDAQVLWSLFTK